MILLLLLGPQTGLRPTVPFWCLSLRLGLKRAKHCAPPLQLVCLELCGAIRDVAFWRLAVGQSALDSTKLRRGNTRGTGQWEQEGDKTSRPHRSSAPTVAAEAAEPAAEAVEPAAATPHQATSRVPLLLGRNIQWYFGVDTILRCTSELSRVTSLQLGTDEYFSADDSFNEALDRIVWPPTLETLKFGSDLNQSLAGITWPSSLTKMAFGYSFTQSITAASWPNNLQHLSFTGSFNQPVADVVWPKSLTHLSLSSAFNQPISGRVFPESLEQLSFGDFFNQTIERVHWPASLLRLPISDGFD